MTTALFAFAFIWLVWGVIELRIAITHAKRYKYSPPIYGAAKYLMFVSILVVFIGVAFL